MKTNIDQHARKTRIILHVETIKHYTCSDFFRCQDENRAKERSRKTGQQ